MFDVQHLSQSGHTLNRQSNFEIHFDARSLDIHHPTLQEDSYLSVSYCAKIVDGKHCPIHAMIVGTIDIHPFILLIVALTLVESHKVSRKQNLFVLFSGFTLTNLS